jgi:hypothetical protein
MENYCQCKEPVVETGGAFMMILLLRRLLLLLLLVGPARTPSIALQASRPFVL